MNKIYYVYYYSNYYESIMYIVNCDDLTCTYNKDGCEIFNLYEAKKISIELKKKHKEVKIHKLTKEEQELRIIKDIIE